MPANSREFPQRDVIIVGGGYGALCAALALHRVSPPAEANVPPYRILDTDVSDSLSKVNVGDCVQ